MISKFDLCIKKDRICIDKNISFLNNELVDSLLIDLVDSSYNNTNSLNFHNDKA